MAAAEPEGSGAEVPSVGARVGATGATGAADGGVGALLGAIVGESVSGHTKFPILSTMQPGGSTVGAGDSVGTMDTEGASVGGRGGKMAPLSSSPLHRA